MSKVHSSMLPKEFLAAIRNDKPHAEVSQILVDSAGMEIEFIGVGDVAVDTNRQCWVLLDAPVFGADFRDVAPLILRRTPDAGYEIQMGGLPDESNFTLIPSPDDSTWVRVQVVEAPGSQGTSSGRVIPG